MHLDSCNIQFLEFIPKEEADLYLSKAVTRDLEDGEILLSPNIPNKYLYILLSGKLNVALDSPESPPSYTVTPGECVGEMSIIDGSPVSAYVIADGPTQVLQMLDQDFWQVMGQSPGIARNLMHILAERMRRQHDVSRKALIQELELKHLAKDLSNACHIQSSMLPSHDPLLPDHDQIEIAASMEPALDVGGDYYDVFALDKNRIAVAIGDVSGKGMPAALFMVQTLTLLRVELTSRISQSLESIGHLINSELVKDNETCMFTTLFLAVIDVTTGEMEYINGGHNHPLFASNNSPFEYLDVPNGMLMGVYEDAPLVSRKLGLQPGDVLFLYTDGVTEAENVDRELFSDERLKRTLNQDGVSRNPRDLITYVRSTVADYAGEAIQSDDITMVAIRYRGSGGESG
jgi:sigma-B regulation protein RsbU (phosphoserine phosphatase)